jgi:uncharacterized protein YndB with AHSA1/START domain
MAKPSLTINRRFNAPPEKVYAAWTRAENLMQWFGPAAAAMKNAAVDVRVGGAFSAGFTTPDGERHDVGGVYKEVVPNRKLVFTWAWRTTPERESLVTLTFKPDGEGTMFTLLHEQFFDRAARDGHERGWTGTMDKLDRFVSA